VRPATAEILKANACLQMPEKLEEEDVPVPVTA